MNSIVVKCPAKINLFLNIVGKKENMHLLNMINNSVNLYDCLAVTMYKNEEAKIIIECDNPEIPIDEKNSVYKALRLMMDTFDITHSFKVIIQKNIPLEAGLGGESTDAAGIIFAVNKLCNLHLSYEQLLNIGFKIGSDVPYCLTGGPCKVMGMGLNIEKMQLDYHFFVIVKPDISMNTRQAFQKYDSLVTEFKKIDNVQIGHNDFELIIPKIKEIKAQLSYFNPEAVNMTGSGTAVVATFKKREDQINCYETIKKIMVAYQVESCSGICLK